jgi:hypothetical protein
VALVLVLVRRECTCGLGLTVLGYWFSMSGPRDRGLGANLPER